MTSELWNGHTLITLGCAVFLATIGASQLLVAQSVPSSRAMRHGGMAHLMLASAFVARVFWPSFSYSAWLPVAQVGYAMYATLCLSAFSIYQTGRGVPRWVWAVAVLSIVLASVGVVWPAAGPYGVGMGYAIVSALFAGTWHFCRSGSDRTKNHVYMMFRVVSAVGALSLAAWVWAVWDAAQSPDVVVVAPWLISANYLFGFWACQLAVIGFMGLIIRDIGMEIERRSMTDPLTGAQNRRGMQQHLEARERRREVSKGGGLITIIAIDLDHFKNVNDVHGHSAGDIVLVRCAERLGALLRGENTLVRVGGEEFLVVCDDAQMEQAMVMAERMRDAMASRTIEIDAQTALTVTVSIGVAVQLHDDEPVSRVIARADEALYRAKNQGRNRVIAFS